MEAKIRKNDRSELWLATAYTNSMTQAIVAMSMNQTNIFNIDFNPPFFGFNKKADTSRWKTTCSALIIIRIPIYSISNPLPIMLLLILAHTKLSSFKDFTYSLIAINSCRYPGSFFIIASFFYYIITNGGNTVSQTDVTFCSFLSGTDLVVIQFIFLPNANGR